MHRPLNWGFRICIRLRCIQCNVTYLLVVYSFSSDVLHSHLVGNFAQWRVTSLARECNRENCHVATLKSIPCHWSFTSRKSSLFHAKCHPLLWLHQNWRSTSSSFGLLKTYYAGWPIWSDGWVKLTLIWDVPLSCPLTQPLSHQQKIQPNTPTTWITLYGQWFGKIGVLPPSASKRAWLHERKD